jgi:hypothetical protein
MLVPAIVAGNARIPTEHMITTSSSYLLDVPCVLRICSAMAVPHCSKRVSVVVGMYCIGPHN